MTTTFDTYIHSITYAGTGMLAFDLRPTGDTVLPPFEAGAHVDVHIAAGVIRQYSLCNNPAERHRYVVCVHHDETGRGGSRTLHETARVGAAARISAPRNHFALHPAARYLLIAGGIGVTPLVAMAEQLHADGAEFELHVYARDRYRLPLSETLMSQPLAGYVTVHLGSAGDSMRTAPPAALAAYDSDTHIYTCGPEGFMAAVTGYASAAGYPEHTVHRERFTPSTSMTNGDPVTDGSFDVVIASTNQRVSVPGDRSIAESLAAHGVEVELSCEQGMCGACLTPVISGIPDHRDDVQTAAEHAANTHITVCCSRAKSAELILDL